LKRFGGVLRIGDKDTLCFRGRMTVGEDQSGAGDPVICRG